MSEVPLYWDLRDEVLNGNATFLDDNAISFFSCWINQHEEVIMIVNFLSGEVKKKIELGCDKHNVVLQGYLAHKKTPTPLGPP